MRTVKILSVIAAATLLFPATTAFARPVPESPPQPHGDGGTNGLVMAPEPVTIDQIVQNQGNIVTTIDNFGYIGGYSYMGLPSGEWPRNSGHSYLAEIRYWMGGINAAGDTLVANTADDFEGMPMPVSGIEDHTIYLSTDTSRYYDYDPTDTVGSGLGSPARGWRVWDPEESAWVHNQKYNSLASDYSPGGPTSLQDSYYRFRDNAQGTPLMGLEIAQTAMQWNYCYNEDFMFVKVEITNASTETYTDFAFGLYVDIDVGGLDGHGENGRLEDLVEYDTAQDLAWIYDHIGYDPGWGPTVKTGFMGTCLLKTPNDSGMTACRTDDWAYLPSDDDGRYAMIASSQFDAPLPPTDQFYVQCVRGVTLTPYETVEIVYALVAGQDEEDLRANADRAREMFNSHYIGPEPPVTPTLIASAGDQKVHLYWNDTAEFSIDPLTMENDFWGYRLYRSDNQGKTWGMENDKNDNNCLTVDYDPVAVYRVASPGHPISHSFIDTGLYNGVEYWYCLVAFDTGNAEFGIDPLQSGFGIAGEAVNVAAVTPRADPAGFYEAAGTVEHMYYGLESPSEGQVIPIVFNRDSLVHAQYEVVFEDNPDTTYWHLVDVNTDDTVLANQTRSNGEPGHFPVVEGLRVVIRNADREPRSIGQTAFGAGDTTLVVSYFYGAALPPLTAGYDTTLIYGDMHFRSTYEFRYTGDSTRANWAGDGFLGTDYFVYWVPFEVWNTTSNERVSLAVYDFEGDLDWDSYDLLLIVNYPYDSLQNVTPYAFPYYYSWMFGFDETVYNPQLGDVFTIEGAPMNGPEDVFTFKVDGVNAAAARASLDDIRVVPNPYFVQYSPMVETDQGSAVLEFQNVPDRCTIRIYTLAGDLVHTIDHIDGSGTARWDLLSSNTQQVASGIYIYHVDSQYGEHLGRFAVIK